MCIPLAVAAMAMAVVGAGTSTYGVVQQGNAQRKAANFNANAQRQTAQSIAVQGAQAAADQRQKGRQVEAAQIAAGAASGVKTDTGTALNLAGETAAFSELDSLRIVNNAQRQAYGYQAQANLEEYQGSQARTGSYLSASASLLSGASNAYFGGKASGAFGGGK